MVVVTDSNFFDWLPTLRKTLVHSDFIAIDFEFLGLDTAAISLHDTTEARYRILRETTIKHRPCQLGITFFKQTENLGYQSDIYTIPLFQRFGDNETKVSFSSLRFLLNNKLNLNQVFTDGVEFCTRREYKMFAKALKKGIASSYLSKQIQMHIELLKVMLHEKCYRTELDENPLTTEEPMQPVKLDIKPNAYVSLKTMRGLCNFEICVIIHELTMSFPYFQFKLDDKNASLNVTKLSYLMTERKNLIMTRDRCSEAYEGISAILEGAMIGKKPVVGHNSLLDAMYTYHYFFDNLPDKYESFKANFNLLFPKFIDTKLLAQVLRPELPGVGDSLERLGDYFSTEKSNKTVPPKLRGFIEPWINQVDDESQNVYHNAGFDSYITGEIFLKLAHTYINRKNEFNNESIEFNRIIQYLEIPIQNRLPFQLMDMSCCHLSGEDVKGSRPDIIRIVRKDRLPIDEIEFQHQEKVLRSLMANYQFDMERSMDRTQILLATNTPGSYAFLCEKFSKDSSLIPLDELESNMKWTFEQRQTAWRNFKDVTMSVVGFTQQSLSRQVNKMELILDT